MSQPVPAASSGEPPPKNKRTGVWTAAILSAVVIIGAMLLNGRAIEQFLFGYGDIYRFLLYHTPWPEEAVQGAALLIWGSYTVAFTVLSYSAIGRLFVGRPTWRVATIGLLALVAQAPLLFFEASLHESPTPITDLKDLQCFDTRTRGRVMVWYYKGQDGAITLFTNGYGGTWRGQELQPATQDICDLAQARWKASESEAQAKEAAKKAAAAELEKKLAALESTHNFEDGKITMQWKAYPLPFVSEDYSVGMRLISIRTIHQPEGQKANVELALNVCNTGEWKIFDKELHIWYVPDDQSRTVRWKYALKDLPTGGCARYSNQTEIDDISSLSMLAGTLYFSDTSARHLTSTHIADKPVGNAKKSLDLASYAPPPSIPQRQIPSTVPPPASSVVPLSNVPRSTEPCVSGYRYIEHSNSCVVRQALAQPFFVAGTKNNCPLDAIFSDRMGRCVHMSEVGDYTLYFGNVVYLSDQRDAYLYIRSGTIRVHDSANGYNTDNDLFLSDPQVVWVRSGATVVATSNAVKVTIEFEIQ